MRRIALVTVVALLALSGLLVSATAFGEGAASSSRAVLKVAFNKKLKKTIVVDGSGRTLYMFTYDHPGSPQCEAQGPDCPQVWPALTSTGKPLARKGINARLITIVKGAGGKPQVSYNHHPLYHFAGGHGTGAGDKKPGDVNGQAFGYAWFVVSPQGTPIRKSGK